MISRTRPRVPTTRGIALLCGLLAACACCAAGDAELDHQRLQYQAARLAWEIRDFATFARLADELRDYPLHPYLEFEFLRGASYARDRERIDRFLTTLGDMPLANRLRTRLLGEFYAQRDWAAFRDHFHPGVSTPALDCQYQEARYHGGARAEATAAGLALWNVAKSQPPECDPLFALLRRDGAITEAIAWQRFARSVRADQIRLAEHLRQRYLTSPHVLSLAKRYLALYRDPGLLADRQLFPEADPEVSELIALAVSRTAQADAPAALAHWAREETARPFDAAARARVTAAIARGLYDQGHRQQLAALLRERGAWLDSAFHEWLLRRRIAAGEWPAVATDIGALPATLQTEPEWRYWSARARVLTAGADDQTQATFVEVAKQRSFYGFLASDWLGSRYQMAPRTTAPDPDARRAFASRPPFLRIRELLHHGQELDAAREWWRATQQLSEAEWDLAGQLAHGWGWHHQAILAMVKASRWDDLETRFPVLHRHEFAAQARHNDLPMPLLFAVARQESAFRADALSPAGARGLMQLMPATATEVAQRHGIPYRGPRQLLDPAVNIQLGTRYYRDMLRRFQDNRILATAAYNAGPGRVRQWLERSGGRLPFDAWIEAIPFLETRNYVQNVLAFSAIYAHRLGSDERILSAREREQSL